MAGAEHPEATDEKYCVYDARHADCGYTAAYVKKLIRECSTEQGFRGLLGMAPKDKDTGEWVGEPPPGVGPWQSGKRHKPDRPRVTGRIPLRGGAGTGT